MAEIEIMTSRGINLEKLQGLFLEVISQNVSKDILTWLTDKAEQSNKIQFNTVFASLSRKTGKAPVTLTNEQRKNIQTIRPGMVIENWAIDRLCRVWLLMQLERTDEVDYFKRIETLFLTAEMNELVALYSSLPVLAHPEKWVRRCAEGIRSNIGDVLTAIICKNPYPSEYLDEGAWNQMVLKAFFTEKPIKEIIGLDERANQKLADTLSDYAHERWAAKRPVNVQLWRCVSRFLNDRIFPDIERLAMSEDEIEKKAAALICRDSSYPAARQLLNKREDLRSLAEAGNLSWENIEGI